MIYEKLLEFITEYAVEARTEIEVVQEDIKRLENEPQYIQKRFILNLFDEIFTLEPEEYRAKKILLLAAVFGKESAIEIMNEDSFLKGKPPIAFLEITFGVGVAEELIKYTQQQLGIGDIELMDDYEQIMFVSQIINEIIGDDMAEWVPKLRLSFGQYLKYGPQAKEVLNNIAATQDKEKLKRFVSSMKKLKYKYSNKDVDKIISTSHEKSERAHKEFETQKRIQKELAQKEPRARLMKAEKEIVSVMGRYIGDDVATSMLLETKKQLNVESLVGAPELARQELMDRLMQKETIQSFSPQRQAILRSYFKTWLNLA